jgi:hypothetical protein
MEMMDQEYLLDQLAHHSISMSFQVSEAADQGAAILETVSQQHYDSNNSYWHTSRCYKAVAAQKHPIFTD